MYFRVVVIVFFVWLSFITFTDQWNLLIDLWEVPLVMTLGSFIAGFSAEGGGAVAFPIFTKVLNVSPVEAKQFSLLIQSVGMTIASLFIFTKKIPFYRFPILPAVAGGAIGQIISFFGGSFLTSVNLKWLFTIHIAALGVALVLQHFSGIKKTDDVKLKNAHLLFFITGIVGGFLTINIGCGADMIAFIVLTLVLNSTEKKATPTTVIIMALNSVIGMLIISIAGEWSAWSIDAWKTAIPIVIFGAPLGAFLASKVSNQFILFALFIFILIEVSSTIWLVPMQNWVIPTFITVATIMCLLVGWKFAKEKIQINS